MNVITRGIRNAFRNATRTISIVIILGLSIGLSLVMLIAHQAVQDKIKTTLSSIGNTVSISPAGYSGTSQVNNALSSTQLAKVARLPHVTNLTETLTDHLQTNGTTDSPSGDTTGGLGGNGSSSDATTSLKQPDKLNCGKGSGGSTTCSGGSLFISAIGNSPTPSLPSDFSLPISIVGTNHPTDPTSIGTTSLTVTTGTAINGNSDSNDAMISTSMAKENNLKTGSTFTAYSKTLTVAAIFDSNTEGGNDFVIVSLPTEQSLSGQGDDVTTATATVASLTNLSSATSAIQKALGSSADVTSNIAQANNALQPLNSVKEVSLYSLIGAVAAGAVIILLTMVMIVRERKREIGVLKAIGFSNIRIMLQFMSEALTFTVLATVIGLLAGVFGGSPITSALISSNSSSLPGASQLPASAGTGAPNISGLSSGKVVTVGDIKDVHTQIGFAIILYGLAAAVIIALVGSALASYFISKVRPAEVLRSE